MNAARFLSPRQNEAEDDLRPNGLALKSVPSATRGTAAIDNDGQGAATARPVFSSLSWLGASYNERSDAATMMADTGLGDLSFADACELIAGHVQGRSDIDPGELAKLANRLGRVAWLAERGDLDKTLQAKGLI